MQRRTPERIEDVPVLQMLDQTVEVMRLVPRERVQQRIDEQIVELPIPKIVEEIVDVVRLVPQEGSTHNSCASPLHKLTQLNLFSCMSERFPTRFRRSVPTWTLTRKSS